MKSKRIWNPAMWAVSAVMLVAGLLGWAQVGANTPGHVSPIRNARGSGIAETDSIFTVKRIRALNADRRKALVSDSEKLVKLARRLDAEVASNSGNDLTPEERREAAEMEKLAHDIKVRMAQSFAQDPKMQPGSIRLDLP